jgi:hypothetical protein
MHAIRRKNSLMLKIYQRAHEKKQRDRQTEKEREKGKNESACTRQEDIHCPISSCYPHHAFPKNTTHTTSPAHPTAISGVRCAVVRAFRFGTPAGELSNAATAAAWHRAHAMWSGVEPS